MAKRAAAKKTRKKKKKAHHARAAAANPPKTRKKKKKAAHRAKAANPRKHKKKKAHHASGARRPARANPGHKRKKKGKRHHRKNPDVPVWAMAALGAVLGLVSFTVVSAGTFAATQRLDPSLGSLVRNRRIAAGLTTLGGVALSLVSPLLGAGVAAGGLAVLAGTEASLALGSLIDKPSGASSSAGNLQTSQQRVNGIFDGSRQQFGGVFDGSRQSFGGVFGYGGHQTFGGLEDGSGQGSTAF